MKTEEIFFIVRIEVNSTFDNIDDSLREMEQSARFLMTDTQNVKVAYCEILTTKTRNPKTYRHGA